MNIVLTGFMGTGKTAVGRHLADRLKIAFFDVDAGIARRAGKPIARIFADQGEPAFREIERQVVAEAAARQRTVIATGGGALIDPHNRSTLEHSSLLVCLTARTGTLLERLKDDATRPLLAGEDLPAKIERLMKERESAYAACRYQVTTDGKTIAEVADEIIQKIAPEWQKA